MKSNLKWFFKITTITSYLKITSKFKKKGPLESLKGKVISNSSFTLRNFLCVARNLERKTNHLFMETKMIKYVLRLYIYGYILWFSYAFKVCSKSVSEIQYIRPVIFVGAAITDKIFDAGTKYLSATDGLLKFS